MEIDVYCLWCCLTDTAIGMVGGESSERPIHIFIAPGNKRMTSELIIQPSEQDDSATCPCCAGSAGVSGFVYDGQTPLAVYFAEPAGMINYPLLHLGIAIGRWGGDADANDRLRAVFSCRPGPQLELVDPTLPSAPELTVLGRGLFPADAENHPKMTEFRAVAEAIIEKDPRLAAMRKERRTHRFTADVKQESGATS
jgi:hypothetical protein